MHEISKKRTAIYTALLLAVTVAVPTLLLQFDALTPQNHGIIASVPSLSVATSASTFAEYPAVTVANMYAPRMTIVVDSLDTAFATATKFDWRDPAYSVPPELTVFPSGLVALSSTLNTDDSGHTVAQCLMVYSNQVSAMPDWTWIWSLSHTTLTLANQAGLVTLGANNSHVLSECTGYVEQQTTDRCNIIAARVVASVNPVIRQYKLIEEMGSTQVYGARIVVQYPTFSSAYQQAVGITVTCWGVESYAFINDTALLQFSPRDASTLQVCLCVLKLQWQQQR